MALMHPHIHNHTTQYTHIDFTQTHRRTRTDAHAHRHTRSHTHTDTHTPNTHTYTHTHTHTLSTTTTHTSRFHLTLGRSRGSWECSTGWRDGMSNERNSRRLADTSSIVGIELSITPLPPTDTDGAQYSLLSWHSAMARGKLKRINETDNFQENQVIKSFKWGGSGYTAIMSVQISLDSCL